MIPFGTLVRAGGEADGSTASSGFLGFVIFFALALALWFLVRNMTGRLRRMNYAESQRVHDRPADPDEQAPGEVGPSDGAADPPTRAGPVPPPPSD